MSKKYLEIKFAGKSEGLKFSVGLIEDMIDEYNVDLIAMKEDYQGKDFMNLYRGIVYCGMKGNYEAKKKDFPFTKEEVKTELRTWELEEINKVVIWLFGCLNTPAELATASEGDAKEEGRFHNVDTD